jgi:hypothetical protein
MDMANFPRLGMCCHGIKFDKFDIDIVRDNPKVLGGRIAAEIGAVAQNHPETRMVATISGRLGGGRDRCCNSRKILVYFKLLRALRLEAGIKI